MSSPQDATPPENPVEEKPIENATPIENPVVKPTPPVKQAAPVQPPAPFLKTINNFAIYACRNCTTLVADPVLHSLQEQHFNGFIIVATVPIDAPVFPEPQPEKKTEPLTKTTPTSKKAKV